MLKFHTLTIKKITKETVNAVVITFEIPSELKNEFNFIAGQYVTIKKELLGEELRRAYSICSAPNSNELQIAVKAVDNGKFSVFATTILKEGDVLEVSKPEGKFILETNSNSNNNYLGIAAGSGITPVISIIKSVLTEEPKSTFTLIYGNRTIADTIFKTDLDLLQKNYENRFKIQYVFSREQNEGALFGRIDTGHINFVTKKSVFDKSFLCGPEEMINSAKETLLENGFDSKNIYFELFSTPVETEPAPTQKYNGPCEITVIVDDEESTFTMDTKNTVLTAALKQGLDAPYSCQGGICSSCLAKVTEGNAVMDKNSILSDEEIKEGFILTCQAHPTTQKITVDYDNV